MNKLKVNLGERSYPISIGSGLLSQETNITEFINSPQVMIVSNNTVADIYLDKLLKTLSQLSPICHIIKDGEEYKTIATFEEIITTLLENKFSRNCCLIALGGGVVGDITGYVAASYQRGANFIQCPTTLLAQVDSSVGGKTAVNHRMGKNMIGAFYQPKSVIIDIDVLSTLPNREFQAGLAEVIKYGVICDQEFFVWLEQSIDKIMARDADSLIYAIERSCAIKADVVAKDEREGDVRAILNFGHTFGHAIETKLNYKDWLHGEAVAVGMVMASVFSSKLGLIDQNMVDRTTALLQRSNLPVMLPKGIRGNDLLNNMAVDKKARNGQLFLVLLKDLGNAFLTSDFDADKLENMLKTFPSYTEAA